jgi:hypothetical protein
LIWFRSVPIIELPPFCDCFICLPAISLFPTTCRTDIHLNARPWLPNSQLAPMFRMPMIGRITTSYPTQFCEVINRGSEPSQFCYRAMAGAAVKVHSFNPKIPASLHPPLVKVLLTKTLPGFNPLRPSGRRVFRASLSSLIFAQAYFCFRNSRTVNPMSLAILRSRIGEMCHDLDERVLSYPFRLHV